MRITAVFNSIDEAELAAMAVKRSDGVFDAAVHEHRAAVDGAEMKAGFFPSAMGMPETYYYNAADGGDEYPHHSQKATVDVICRASSAAAVKGALLSKGGHDMKATG